MKFSSKKSASLKTWKQKFYIHTGERLNWFQIILRLQGSILLNIIPWVAFFAGYSLIIVLLDYHEKHLPLPKITAGIPNIILSLNLILSLLLVFRLNAAYDRYWEGRKLWGALVNSVRNLTRGIVIVVETSSQLDRLEKEETVRLTVAFAVAMKLHLRGEPVDKQLIVLISSSRYSKLQNTNHLPLTIALWIGEYLQDQYRHKSIGVYQLTILQNLLDELVNILGGCERILKTPTPLALSIFLKQLLILYCLSLPIEMVDVLKWWTVPVVIVITSILFGIDEIGSELENPFGRDPNDLPLDVICDGISNNAEELIQSQKSVPFSS